MFLGRPELRFISECCARKFRALACPHTGVSSQVTLRRRMSDRYEGQHRGGDDAYERYLSGMDRSMRQKVAVTAAHLLGEGTVADMGMGSGSGTLALAALYPRVRVVGVDVNPEMVERARSKHVLENLSFVQGDIAARVFDADKLDGIFNSSVLHHVT